MASRIARHRGHRVIAIDLIPERLERVRAFGAETIDLTEHGKDLGDVVRNMTEGRGVDVILDIMGAKYLDPNLRSLAAGGRQVTIGLQGGVKGELNLGLLLSRQARPRAVAPRLVRQAVQPAVIETVNPVPQRLTVHCAGSRRLCA